MINGGIASLLAIYFILVLYHGKSDQLLAMVREEIGFLKWITALFVLMIVYRLAGGKVGEIIKQLTLVALAGLMVTKGEVIFKQIGDSFKLDQKSEGKRYGTKFD